eukprot:m.183334 g.183334  ORF g.183334 m.183334 type:complete len:1150 (-) comp16892_c0_seq3:108-3557(-)
MRLILLLSAIAAVGIAQRPVKLGYVAVRSFFGQFSAGGFQAELALRASVEYFNAQTTSDVEIELVYAETSATSAKGNDVRCAEGATELVDAGAQVVVGPASSSCSIPSAAVFAQTSTAQISHAATAEALSNKTLYPSFFRILPSDALQGVILADFAADCQWPQVGAILTDDAWALGLRKTLAERLAQLNITFTNVVEIPAGSSVEVVQEALRELRAGGTAVNAIFALRNDVPQIMDQAVLEGMVGPGWTWLAPDGTTTSVVVSTDTLAAFNGMIGVAPLEIQGPLVNIFDTYIDSWGWHQFVQDVSAPGFTLRMFDTVLAVHSAVDTITDWNTLTLAEQRAAIVAALRTFNSDTASLAGASAPAIFFDQNQDGPPAYALVNLVDGEYKTIGTFQGQTRVLTTPIQWPEGEGLSNCPSAFIPATPTTLAPEASSNSLSDTWLAVIISLVVILLLLLLLIAYARYKYLQKVNRPHDFDNELSTFAKMGSPNTELVKPKELRRRDIELGLVKGEGSTAVVHHGVMVDPATRKPKEVAIKMLKSDDDASARELLFQEAAFMAQLDHPNLVHCYGVVTIGKPWLVMEYCVNGSLDEFLRHAAEKTGLKYSMTSKIHLALDVANGMVYLSSRGLIHRDIACRNVFVDSAAECKLADFGLSRNNTYYASSDRPIPIKWTAPESLVKGRFTTASDVWAFGVLLVEIILNGQLPYPGMSNEAVRVAVCGGGYRHPRMPEMPLEVYKLMEACWHEVPMMRPTFEDIREELIRLEGSMELMQYSASMTPVHSHPMLSRDMSASADPLSGKRSSSPQTSARVAIQVDEAVPSNDVPTRPADGQGTSIDTPRSSYEQAVVAQARAKAQALRQTLKAKESTVSHAASDSTVNHAASEGHKASVTTESTVVSPTATPGAVVATEWAHATLTSPKQSSNLTLKSDESAITRPSYDKAMDRPGYVRGASAIRGAALPTPTRQDVDASSQDERASVPGQACSDMTDLDAALESLKPPMSQQGSYQQALGSAPLSPGSLPNLRPPVADPQSELQPPNPTTNSQSRAERHPPRLQRQQRTPASVGRQDSYANATMAQGILSPGSLPRLMFAVRESEDVAKGPSALPPVMAAQRAPHLDKQGSYAVALDSMMSPGSLPNLRTDQAQESVV